MSGQHCANDCEGLQRLKEEIDACSAEKDAQINSLAHQLSGLRGDLLRIDGDLKNLTNSVEKMSTSLEVIAANTTQFMEVAQMYQNFKGFGFVVKNIGVIFIGAAALVTAIIFLAGLKISIGS